MRWSLQHLQATPSHNQQTKLFNAVSYFSSMSTGLVCKKWSLCPTTATTTSRTITTSTSTINIYVKRPLALPFQQVYFLYENVGIDHHYHHSSKFIFYMKMWEEYIAMWCDPLHFISITSWILLFTDWANPTSTRSEEVIWMVLSQSKLYQIHFHATHEAISWLDIYMKETTCLNIQNWTKEEFEADGYPAIHR